MCLPLVAALLLLDVLLAPKLPGMATVG